MSWREQVKCYLALAGVMFIVCAWWFVAFVVPDIQKCDNLREIKDTNQIAAVDYAKECP